MNYQQIYDNIVRRGQNRILEGYSEKHHIVPRCMGGTNDADNLVSLTPEEHYLCHLLLVKIHPSNIKLVKAAIFMVSSNNNVKRNNKAYGWLKRQYSNSIRGIGNPNYNGEARKKYIEKHGIPEVNKDYITKEWRGKISKRMMGDKNPCAGVKPWNHPRATDITRALWKRADEIYNVWIAHNKPSYCKLFGLVMNEKYKLEIHGKEISPYMNMVKYFKNGWIPEQDDEWKKV
jgi:hypothetical protein